MVLVIIVVIVISLPVSQLYCYVYHGGQVNLTPFVAHIFNLEADRSQTPQINKWYRGSPLKAQVLADVAVSDTCPLPVSLFGGRMNRQAGTPFEIHADT